MDTVVISDVRDAEQIEALRKAIVTKFNTDYYSVSKVSRLLNISRPTITKILDGHDCKFDTLIRVANCVRIKVCFAFHK